MIVEWTGLCRIHGGRAATASAESTCPVNRATNRSFAPCVPYQEFLAYGDEIRRVKFRLASLQSPGLAPHEARRVQCAGTGPVLSSVSNFCSEQPAAGWQPRKNFRQQRTGLLFRPSTR